VSDARQVQVRLCSGATERTCWVDRPGLRTGQVITLKNSEDPDQRWTVLNVYTEGTPPDRGWRVGGL
jgi:hypothetical protein